MIQQRFYRHFFFMVLLALLCSWIPGAALAKAPLTAAVPARANPSLVPNNVANSVPAPHAVLANPAKTATASAPARTRSIGALPLAFVANAGQTDSAVRFLVRSRGGTFFFTPAEAVLAVPILDPNAPFVDRGRRSGQTARVAGTTVVRLQYQGANPARALRAGERMLGVVNDLTGTNPTQWHTNLATYASVSYAQLYTGIDLRYEGVDGQLKRTYAVAAGANPANIRWRYAGATAAQLDTATGDLVITLPAPAAGLPGATLTERAPIAWQDSGGQRIPVSVRYDVAPNGSIGFVLGAYDTTQPLTIDPVLSYSTFLGGNVIDEGSGMTVDSSGNAYIAGGSYSSNFPTAGALQGTRAGSEDVIVSKVSADGTTLLYSTFLGGSGEDEANAIALDASGNIVLAGETASSNFPTQNALDSTFGGGACTGAPCNDAVIVKLNAAGNALLYSSYLGGSGTEEGTGVAVDSSGMIYATGVITSTTGVTMQNAYDSTYNGGSDAFVVKLNPALSGSASLLYSTYLGGGADEQGNAIAVDSAGAVYVAGETYSRSTTPFPTQNAFQSIKGSGSSSSDAFFAKLNPALAGGASLLYSSYLGGSSYDKSLGITVDSATGYAYLTGYAQSTNFPTVTPLQASNAGDKDAFVATFNPAASGSASLLYSSYLGGAAEDRAFGIARDGAGILYLTGLTRSSNFPTASPIQNSIGGGTCGTVACSDVFVTQFILANNALGWSTYLGGTNDDEGDAIAVDSSAAAYLTGKTASTNFPTTAGVRQGTYGGGSHDAFVAKIGASTATNGTITLTPAGATNVRGTTQTLQATLNDQQGAPITGIVTTFTVSGPNATSGSATTNASGVASFTYTGNITGTDTVQATASVGGAPIASNVAHIGWVAPLQPVATTTIWGRFFFNPGNTGAFSATPSQTPAFTQAFPTINFNPPSGTVPGAPGSIGVYTRPMVDITTDLNGTYTGSMVAQGNGYQAGADALYNFDAVFTGEYIVTGTLDVTFNFYSDDGFIFGVGNGATPGMNNPFIGVGASPYPPTAFANLPMMGAYNITTDPHGNSVTVHFPGAGTYPYEIDYSECCDGQLALTVTASTAGNHGVPPSGALTLVPASPASRPTGQAQVFTTRAVDAAGNGIANLPVALTVTGANPQQINATTSITGLATLSYTGANVGTDSMQAVAWVNGVAIYSGQVAMTWTPGTVPPPSAPLALPGQIGSPKNGSIISDTVPIILGPGVPAQTCIVDYWPATNPSGVVTLAPSASGSGGSTLATLDTTTLANGAYIIRTRCTDGGGTQVNSGVLVTVVGENKPGRVRFSVTDLTVPLTGLPITIGRTYDSLDRGRSGDFGYGWSLSIGSPRLEVNAAHDVTVTQPNGKRVTFFFSPRSYGGVLGFLLAPAYTPEPGAFGTLTANGCDLLVASGGGYVCFLDGAYQPTTYTYTDPYGRVFVMGADGTLQSITDLNANVLTFGATGISSSAGGRTVAFVRDGQNRITQITDPAGKPYTYVYSTTGDLGSVSLPSVATPVRYGYDSGHLITGIVDPRGNHTAIATYDTDGRLKDETDAIGNTTSYVYNAATNTTTTTYPDLGVRSQTFDGYGSLLSETDPLTHTTNYQYFSSHLLKQRTDALGHIASYTYDANGNQTSVTGPLGATSRTAYNVYSSPTVITDTLGYTQTIAYNADFMPSSIKDSLGTRSSFTFDSHGSMLSSTDGNGKTTTSTYDPYGNKLSETDPLTHTTDFTYDTLGRMLTSTDALTKTTKYQYDPLGHTVAITDAGNFVTKYTYDGDGNRITETDARTNPTTSIYDKANRLQYIHFADTSAISYTYTFRGDKDTETDQLGHVTKYGYDKAGQLTSVTSAFGTPDAAMVAYEYDAIGQRTSETDPRGKKTTTGYNYDLVNHVKQVVVTAPLPLSYVTTSTFDAAGHRIKLLDANSHLITYHYDPRGRLDVTTYPDTPTTTSQIGYDGGDNVKSRTDQAGHSTTYVYDAANRLHQVSNPLHQTTTYDYDVVNNLIKITDANSHITQFEYNALHQRTKQILPSNVFALYDYDPDGNLSHATDFIGKQTTYTYDTLNRLTTITPDASLTGQTPIGFTFFPIGQRKTMTDASGITTYAYTARNQLLSKATPQGTLSYTYNLAGGVQTLRSSNTNGITVTYGYDELNRLSTVTDNRLTAGANTTTYVYSPTSTLKSVTLPNTAQTTYGYDPLDRLTSLTARTGATTLANITYTLWPEGNRKHATEQFGAGTRQVDYSYDLASRLLTETVTLGTPSGVIGYMYDPVGNRLSRTSTVAGITATSATYDANDQLAGNSYDSNGNTTVASGVTYGYDFLNRLTSATSSGGITFTYDGDGTRVQATASGVTTSYLVDDQNPTGSPQVVEELVGGAVQRQYTYGHALISQTQVPGTPTTSFYGDDGLGSVRYLTDTSGATTDRYDYDAFGNLLTGSTPTPNSYRFAGEQLDANLGLYYLRARYYNSGIGRFWSRDTVEVEPSNPSELNRYVYTADNPVNAVDPSGLFAIETAALGRTTASQGLLAVIGQNVLLSIGATALTLCAIGTAVSLSTAVASSNPCDVTHFNVFYSGIDTPFTTIHIASAILSGQKVLLHRISPKHSRAWLSKDPRCSGRSRLGFWCDEYPFASTREGGEFNNASLKLVPFWEQSVVTGGQGAKLKAFYDRCHIIPNDPINGAFAVVPSAGPTDWVCR